jgi:[protein-PII] uridylyltransferase
MHRPDAEVEDLAWLVREHLLLVETATRRDLSDRSLIDDIAARIGTARRTRLLFLLTVADGVGTGPTAWTPWKAELVTELFTKVVHVLERGDLAHGDLEQVFRERTDAVIRFAIGSAALSVAHLEAMGQAYLLRFEPEEIVRHATLAHGLEVGELRTVHHTLTDGSGELTVIAPDAPGLFRRVCGVLALHSLSIVAAELHTRDDGVAFEWIRCVGPRNLPIEEERWSRIEPDLERTLRGKLSLEARLAEKRASGERPSKGKQAPPKVVTNNEASSAATIVEVHATDRLGLLYDITAALADCGLDVQRAKIATYGDDVVDVFYVRSLDGAKVADPAHLAEIERAILHRLR